MKLRYLSSILPQQEGASRICGVSCSAAGLKTAIAGSDRSILLLDEKGEQRDKFATKPIESKFGKKSYIIKCVAFSPDGSKIAIGQTDNVVFVYKIGASWNEKKVIVNKLMQTSAVTALDWPFDDKLLIGLLDGKVRVGLIKSNKCSSLYKTDQAVVAMQSNPKKTAFVSGHQDGSVILYNFSTKSQSKILNLQLAPYCLAFTAHGLLIGGSDRRILSYTETGVIQQQFDYTDQGEKEFSACAVDPTGQNVVVASYDRLRLFSWSSRRGAWDEGTPLEIQNLYAVTVLGWKGDGSAIFCGTLCGGLVAIDCCLRRGMLKSRFETTYVAPSHVIVRDVNSESRTDVISNKGLAIDDLKMMGKDRYVVATTSTTLILADTETAKSSEIDWHSGGNEKFYFEFAHVCLLINAGEITVVEYGADGPLGWVRTELTNPHLLSVRVVTRESGHGNVKKMAYLPDPTTIAIQNFITSDQEMSLTHTAPVDWLELNESATKLLFRDKRSRVTLVDLESQRKTNLLSFCSYVQWVPLSDVVVAQSGETLHIWYNPDLPEQVTTLMIRGDVEDVLRDADRTEVIVQESTSKIAYELDNTQIEFGTALEQRDFERAVAFLESNTGNMDTYTMWRRVADLALEQHKLLVAQRCFAAINDVARVNLLHDTVEIATRAASELGGDGTQHYKVRANLARMAKKFKEAEKIYMQQNSVEEAIEMYQTLHKWDEALELAKATNYPGYEQLKATYYRSLFDTGQEAKAAELKIADGDVQGAVQLYLKGNQPAKALAAALADPNMANDQALMQSIAQALLKGHIYDKAGDLFERMKDFEKALECYKKGNSFAKAVELARFAFPEQVVGLHEEWGDHLVLEGQDDTAINHYLESNKTLKAVEAAMKAKEWNKAVQIVDVIQDQNTSRDYYGKIADHYASVGDYERAERLFIEADLPQDAITMYLRNNKWADAYRLSVEFLGKEETHGIYERKAAELEEQGRLTEAEQLYISIGLSEKAIQMYMAAGRNEDVVRLVERYHGEHIQETHKRLGMEHEERGDYKAAEEEYLKADDWQAAINMYRSQDMWNDAFRLAKSEGNENSQKQVIFLWASSLGGEAAVKLLNKHGMLQTAIDLAIERGSHDFAFDLSKLGAKERLPEVHKNLAHQLEDAGKLDEAGRHYVEGGFPNEAVEMYLHVEDFTEAEKIAKEYSPDALKKVYEAQALLALKEGDHAKAESFLLRANRPDIILRYFKEQGMWPDALRIAKEFLPNQLPQLQEEYDKAELRSGARGVDSYVAQAKEFEGQSDWTRAVQTYLKVSPEATENMELVRQCTLKAADISTRFLMGGDQQLLEQLIERLEEMELYEKLAELLLTMGNTPRAVMALCKAQQWSKAKQIAAEYQPALIPEIEAAYKESLRNEGRLGELIDVDVISAIDLLIERGQWEKALDTAKQTKHVPLLDKYVAQYAAELLPHGDYGRLLKVFEKYGASANPTNFNLYRAILEQAVEHKRDSPVQEYERIAPVRNLFLNIVESMRRDGSQYLKAFERFVHALNLLTLRSALELTESSDAPRLRLKQSLSLLRYTDILPVDRIFYEAGVAAKEYGQGYENVAFVLLNHYLDLVDAIDEGNAELVDYTVFEGTDIPTEIDLPQNQWTESSEHEEIKEWVLATSVDDAAQRELLLDKRGVFEASLVDASGQSYEPCIITGYPVIASPIHVGDLMADREELNRFLIIVKTSQSDQLLDVQDFISKWAKSALAMAL